MLRTNTRKVLSLAVAVVGLLLSAPSSLANEALSAANAFTPLLCNRGDGFPGFVEAEPSFKPQPKYPKNVLNDWSEGWAQLEYAIKSDGTVHNIEVVDSLGPPEFVASSVKAVANWRYKPATRSGLPVEQFLKLTSVLYLIEGSGREAAHEVFVRKYNNARAFMNTKQYKEAIAVLETAFKARLNLYEEAMGSFALAIAYAQKGDWQRALFHIRHSTIEEGRYLEKSLQAHAFALQVELEARDWNFVAAECAFKSLRLIDPPSAAGTSEPAEIIGRIHAAVNDAKPLIFEARLATSPLIEAPAVWRHQLLRGKFFFAELKGEVRSFRLACTGAAHEAPIDTETQWDVPSNAGVCILRVYGAPGATFRLIEE